MFGVAELWIMSRLPIERQFFTATARLRNLSAIPPSKEAFETKVAAVDAVAPPNDPNIGPQIPGWGVGMDALASPITLQAMKPPLITISGFTPNMDGLQRTRSASLPGSIDPTSCAMPCVTAGL